jgi:hypothetical protein
VGLYVISYGQIPLMMDDQVLGHHQEEQDTVGVKILRTNSIIETILK